jgi:hypothetical protein
MHHAFAGIAHGGIDYALDTFHCFETMAFTFGASQMDFDFYERMGIENSFNENQGRRSAFVETFVQKGFAIDPFHPTYQFCRTSTNLGLEIGSLAVGGYSLAKGGFKLIQSSRHLPRASSLLSKEGSKIASQIARKELKLSSLNGTQLDLDALSKAGQVMDRNGLTKAGRSLQKHSGRVNSVYPRPNGKTAAEINQHGHNILDNILTHPDGRVTYWSHRSFGNIFDIEIPGKGGARFYQYGNFIGFLEP